LTLFDVDAGPHDEASTQVRDSRSIDEILASIAGGPDSHQQIFEALKSVAKSQGSSSGEVDVLADEPAGKSTPTADVTGGTAVAPGPAGEQFICPVCESYVDANASTCPSCGAQFAEGEAAEFECPVCRAAVASNADVCPNCGVRFETGEEPMDDDSPAAPIERPTAPAASGAAPGPPATAVPRVPAIGIGIKDRLAVVRLAKRDAVVPAPSGDRKLMYRELPKLVNDVKTLLVSAKRMGLEIDKEKRLINEAIGAGKQRDIERAVRMINEAKHALDIAFTEAIAGRIEAFVMELNRAGPGAESARVERSLQEAVDRLEAGNYDAAFDQLQAATKGFQSGSREYIEAKDVLDEDDRLLAEARGLGMDSREIERLMRQGREAMVRRDQANALRSAKLAKDRMAKELPVFIQEEMRKARNRLLDLKVRGSNLSKPIGILKAASVHAKREEWRDAMRYLKEFRKEVESL
jgi:predicted RNA-binding Zn-ribbon protein involved in translation (DUF1610 family)